MEDNIAHKPISSASTIEEARIEIIKKCFVGRHLPEELQRHILNKIEGGLEVSLTPFQFIELCIDWVIEKRAIPLPNYTSETPLEDLLFHRECSLKNIESWSDTYRKSCRNPSTPSLGLSDGSIFNDGNYLAGVYAAAHKRALMDLDVVIRLKKSGIQSSGKTTAQKIQPPKESSSVDKESPQYEKEIKKIEGKLIRREKIITNKSKDKGEDADYKEYYELELYINGSFTPSVNIKITRGWQYDAMQNWWDDKPGCNSPFANPNPEQEGVEPLKKKIRKALLEKQWLVSAPQFKDLFKRVGQCSGKISTSIIPKR